MLSVCEVWEESTLLEKASVAIILNIIENDVNLTAVLIVKVINHPNLKPTHCLNNLR